MPRAVTPMLDTLRDPDPDVRIAGLGVARTLLDAPRGSDGARRRSPASRSTRPAAAGSPRGRRGARGPARADPAPAGRIGCARMRTQPFGRSSSTSRSCPPADPVAALAEAAGNGCRRIPDYVLSLVAEAGAATPLPTLHRLVGAIREREQAETRPGAPARLADRARRRAPGARGPGQPGCRLRSARGHRDGREPLPDDFVRAATVIGDATVLEALVGALCAHGAGRRRLARGARRRRPRDHLARAAHEATRRRKRLRARYGDAVAGLLPR